MSDQLEMVNIVRHGSGPVFDGCRDYRNKSAKHAAKLMAQGKCVVCKKPNPKGTRRCHECTTKTVQGNKRIRAEANQNGRCVDCGIAWSGATKNCDACKAKQREKWHNRPLSQHCARCAGKRDSKYKACKQCRQEMRRNSKRRRSEFADAGKCVQCGRPKNITCLYCDVCIFKTAARRWLGDSKLWSQIKTLLEKQSNKCAYTGSDLILGGNASIDHKTPRSRGGTNEIGNLQWVSWNCNRYKSDMTHAEFVNFCHVVASKYPKV